MPNSFHTTQRNTSALVSNDVTLVKSNKNFFLTQTDNSGFNVWFVSELSRWLLFGCKPTGRLRVVSFLPPVYIFRCQPIYM